MHTCCTSAEHAHTRLRNLIIYTRLGLLSIRVQRLGQTRVKLHHWHALFWSFTTFFTPPTARKSLIFRTRHKAVYSCPYANMPSILRQSYPVSTLVPCARSCTALRQYAIIIGVCTQGTKSTPSQSSTMNTCGATVIFSCHHPSK